MKLIITRDEFIQGLTRACGVADRKSSMAVLANVLLEIEEPGGLRISATDLHLSVTGVVSAQIKTDGSTTVAARTLFDIAKKLPAGDVSLSVDKNQWLVLKCGRVRYRIAGIPAEDFPMLPSTEDVDFFCLESELLKNMIERTYVAVSPDEGRPHMNGALFEGKNQSLRMVATDGHRLCFVEKIVESEEFNFSILIPLKGLQELRHFLDKGAGKVEVGVGGSCVFFRRHQIGVEDEIEREIILSVKLVGVRFPPYEKVIPKTSERHIIVNRALFVDALNRASLITRDKVGFLQLVFSDGKITVTSNNPDVGEASEEIDAQCKGETFTVGFNGHYFMDVLRVLKSESIELSLNGPSDPCIIKSMDNDGFLGVVMPMKL